MFDQTMARETAAKTTIEDVLPNLRVQGFSLLFSLSSDFRQLHCYGRGLVCVKYQQGVHDFRQQTTAQCGVRGVQGYLGVLEMDSFTTCTIELDNEVPFFSFRTTFLKLNYQTSYQAPILPASLSIIKRRPRECHFLFASFRLQLRRCLLLHQHP